MSVKSNILICGTGASGSSGVFEYLNSLDSICGEKRELKQLIRRNIYSSWVRNKYKNTAQYKAQMKIVIEKLIGSRDKPLILNNSISCLQLRGIQLLDNFKTVCVIRDPRSTWIAWQTEWVNRQGNKKWSNCSDPIGAFIISYRKCMFKFFSEYMKVNNKEDILVVNFEDFVLRSECRDKVLKFLDLDFKDSDIDAKDFLRPKDKSIFVHKYWNNKAEIRRIKKELSGYCHSQV